jgi:hypothetical protein
MVRVRNALMAVALGTGAMGCAISQPNLGHYSIWHCDECDDFPTPAYGPDSSMYPGTYTGAPARDRPESSQPATNGTDMGSVPPPAQQPAASTPLETATPPLPPAASPGPGAANRSLPSGVTAVSSAVTPHSESN